MDYEPKLATENYDAEWLEHYGDTGTLEIVCSEVVASPTLVSGGWTYVNVCPVCGVSIDLTMEKL